MSIPLTNESCQHQFENRYSIYCHDPFEYNPVSIELIQQLAIDLNAQGAVIVDTEMSSDRQGRYLTADSFDVLQDQINQKEEARDFLAEGYDAYLLGITSSLFYKGYPKLFWKTWDFSRIDLEDEWGEVSYCQPINKRNLS
jgi:hypothetical protein